MENASKALIMAGSILIAILIITLIIYMSTTTTRLAEAQDEKKIAEQTAAFNKEYEVYDKSRMYGTDIITVINKANNYNSKLDVTDQEYKISIIIKDKAGRDMNISYESEFKTAIFKCTNVTYSGITGRVNSMTFIQV